MRYILISLLVLTGMLFTSCGDSETVVEDLVAEGGKKYGGEFKFMSAEKITSLFPAASSDQYSSRIVGQIYESLLRIDPETMQVVPAIAESFKVSQDAKVYTFKIRKGVLFHADDCISEGREVNAHDVKLSLELACSGLKSNDVAYLLVNRISGAAEFNKKSKTSLPKEGVSGIKVLDDHTVQITLENSFTGFEKVLTHSALGVMPKEAWEKYGEDMATHPVGTGPFALESFADDKIVLTRNNH